MSLSLRTVKTALAAFLSIVFATVLGLDYAVSAGIIAILSVMDTNKSTLTTAGQRVISTVLALGIAAVLFNSLGFHTYVFGLFLLLYIPSAYRLGVEIGIAPCSVLVTHLLVEESISMSLIHNELLLMLIGAGIAILINLYMPSKNEQILKLRDEADDDMREALLALSNQLQEGTPMNPDLLDKMENKLNQAEKMLFVESENRLLIDTEYNMRYIEMRKNQTVILRYMYQNVQICRLPMQENKILAGLFYLTANQLHENNTGEYILEDIHLLLQQFRESDLPKSRPEFENRAVLFQLLNDFTRFIQSKKTFFDDYG